MNFALLESQKIWLVKLFQKQSLTFRVKKDANDVQTQLIHWSQQFGKKFAFDSLILCKMEN